MFFSPKKFGSVSRQQFDMYYGEYCLPSNEALVHCKRSWLCSRILITNEQTFEEVKQLWEQIKEVRENYQEIPCVIVGNHLDEENNRQIERFDALNWAYNEVRKLTRV
jgi:GTPase involved in cell partitioning and DNA repair